jgi:hypothetical protein
MDYPANPTTGAPMKDMKRGKLRSVTTRPMYDEKQNISGYTVSADHDADDSGGKDIGGYMRPIETPHETMESATAKHGEHLATNAAKFNGKKKGSEMDEEPMRAALGRKK